MKYLVALLVMLCSCSVQAQWRYYMHFTLLGTEVDGPAPTEDWDLGLFRGLSLTPGIGIQYGNEHYALDLVIERFDHTSFPLIGSVDDRLDIKAYIFKFIGRVKFDSHWQAFVGLGSGNADIDMQLNTCATFSGCGASPWQYPPQLTSARILTFEFGIAYTPDQVNEFYLGFENFKSDALGFQDITGTPYYADKLKLAASFIGFRRYFQ